MEKTHPIHHVQKEAEELYSLLGITEKDIEQAQIERYFNYLSKIEENESPVISTYLSNRSTPIKTSENAYMG